MSMEIGSLLIDMRADVARLGRDMSKAQTTVNGAMQNVQRAASAATTALGLIGAGVSVAGMASVVKGAIGAMAALDDMAAKAGTTVENMSALADVAKIGGHDLSAVEGAMVRLTKALAGGDEEAKGAGHALAALGLKAEDLRGMDTAEAMLAVANALAKYENGAGKTALMLDLLGKSGAAAIPFFEDLAEKGKLVAKVTAEQAAEAEKLEKEMAKLKVMSDDTSRSIASALVPALLKFTEQLVEGKTIAGGWLSAMWEFGVLLDPTKGIPQNLNETREALGKLHAEMAKGMAQNLADGGQTDLSDVDKRIQMLERRKKFLDFQQRQEVEAKYTGAQFWDARDIQARQKESLSGYKKGETGGKSKYKKSDLQKMIELGDSRLASYIDGGEGALSVATVAGQYENQETEALEGRRSAMEAMAQKRMEDHRITTEGEEAIREAMEKTARESGKHFSEMSEFAREASRNIQDSLADNLYDALQGNFDNIEGRFTSMLDRMVANAMAARLSDAMFGDFGKTGNMGGIVGELFGGFGQLFAGESTYVASQGFGMAGEAGLLLGFANGGDHAGGYRVVGENGPELEATGPSRIFNANQTRDILSGGSGGDVTVIINESPTNGGQVRQRDEGSRKIIEITVERVKSDLIRDVHTNGSFAQAAQRTWGVPRTGAL